MREVVMVMCERSGCAFVITFWGSSPSTCTLFGCFSLKTCCVLFMYLSRAIEIPRINLYVVV